MTYLVVNCFHWVGFHLVNSLLEHGNEVDGLDSMDNEQKEHLSMYFGRNALFKHIVKRRETKDYEAVIIIDEENLPKINHERIYHITFKEEKSREKGIIEVICPILFGEWMPMNEKGIHHNNQFIPFQSSDFQEEAVYIGDFVTAFKQILEMDNVSKSFNIYSANNRKVEDKKLENCAYIRDNIPIEQKVKHIVNHYKQYKDYYVY